MCTLVATSVILQSSTCMECVQSRGTPSPITCQIWRYIRWCRFFPCRRIGITRIVLIYVIHSVYRVFGEFLKPKGGSNILPMSIVCHNMCQIWRSIRYCNFFPMQEDINHENYKFSSNFISYRNCCEFLKPNIHNIFWLLNQLLELMSRSRVPTLEHVTIPRQRLEIYNRHALNSVEQVPTPTFMLIN